LLPTFAFRTHGNNVVSCGHTPNNLHVVPGARRVLNHDYRIRSAGDSGPGHDCDSLPRRDCRNLPRTGSRFSDNFQSRWNGFQVGREHGISVTRRPWKRRDVAIGMDRLGQNASAGIQQSKQFPPFGPQVRSMALNHGTSFFKA
jgi:hypothetical protein